MSAGASIRATLILILLAGGTVVPGRAQVAPLLNAKVQETLMGPRAQRIVLSDDGDHLAIVTAKGSRQVVLIDGVEGPVFDEIPANTSGSWGTGADAIPVAPGFVGRKK